MRCTRCHQAYTGDEYEVCPVRGAPWPHTQMEAIEVVWRHEPGYWSKYRQNEGQDE